MKHFLFYHIFLTSPNGLLRSWQVREVILEFGDALERALEIDPDGVPPTLEEIGRCRGVKWYRTPEGISLQYISKMGDGEPDTMAKIPITQRPGAIDDSSTAQPPDAPTERDISHITTCRRRASLFTGPEVRSDCKVWLVPLLGRFGVGCVRQRHSDVRRLLAIKGPTMATLGDWR